MEDPKAAAERLHTALFGKNRDETCLDIVINNDLEHRLLIAKKYGELFGNPLYEDMKSKLSGNFKELCGYCFLTPMEFNAKMLKRGFKGLSIDDQAIFEILACHTLEEYKQIQDAYKVETGKELTKDLEKNFSGALRKNVLNLISTERRTNPDPDKAQCEKLADLLVNNPEKAWIEDENIFRDVFLLCSPEELVLVGRFYFQKTGNNLIDVVEKNSQVKTEIYLEKFYSELLSHMNYMLKNYVIQLRD